MTDINIDALYRSALKFHLEGNLIEAEKIYLKILNHDIQHHECLHMMGVISHQKGKLKEAVIFYKKSIQISSKNANVFSNLSYSLCELNLLNESLIACNEAIKLKKNYAEAYSNKGNVLNKLFKHGEAIEACNIALAIRPNFAEALSNRGIAYQELYNYSAAEKDFKNALIIRRNFYEAYSNLGNTLNKMHRYEVAVVMFNQAISLKRDFYEAYSNMGVALQQLNHFKEALICYKKSLNINNQYAPTYSNRGLLHQKNLNIDSAIKDYENAISLNPNFFEAHWNRSLALLMKGDLKNGFKAYEWRWFKNNLRIQEHQKYKEKLWSGSESLKNKKILIFSEQGYGDTLQFARFIKDIKARGAIIYLVLQKSLVKLIELMNIADFIIETNSILPIHDYQCPLMSLPLALGINIHNIPNYKSYLFCNLNNKEMWTKRLGEKTKLRIGIVWRGNGIHENDRNRSFQLQRILPYLVDDFEYISIQKEISDVEAELLKSRKIKNFSNLIEDFVDTASLISLVDLVLTVDTSVAHLAGGLGIMTWILLPFEPDWRWLLDRSDSPWYPSVTLIRQKKIGDWADVFMRVRNYLLNYNYSQKTKFWLEKAYDSLKNQSNSNLEKYCTRIITIDPCNTEAIHLLSICYFREKNHIKALTFINNSLEIDKTNYLTYSNKALFLFHMNRVDEAIESCLISIIFYPSHVANYSNLGLFYNNKGKDRKALEYVNNAIFLNENFIDAIFNKGMILNSLNDYQGSIECFRSVIKLNNYFDNAYIHLGSIYKDLKQNANAKKFLEFAICINPKNEIAFFNLGNLLKGVNLFNKSITCYDKALLINPFFESAYLNRGVSYAEIKDFVNAYSDFDSAIDINPSFGEAHFNKANFLLLNRDFENGLLEYEYRFNDGVRNYIKPSFIFRERLWTGKEPLIGKTILLHSEQGFGDVIQFCRYALLLSNHGGEVILRVSSELLELLQHLGGVSQVISDKDELPFFDYQCPIMSLPLALSSIYGDFFSIPLVEKYLNVNQSELKEWNSKLGYKVKPRIGLCWRGNPLHKNDRNRSLNIKDLSECLSPNHEYISLQKEQIEYTSEKFPIIDCSHEIEDFSDTAALCMQMDLVITVDTSIAHLAGALGIKTWILLPALPDWRWFLDCDESIWYQSIKLYRQDQYGDWSRVIARIKQDLETNFEKVYRGPYVRTLERK
jgi:tetratricopeptide (TPR) repeat protein